MSAAAKKGRAPERALTLSDFVVRAARGYERPDGGIVWSGMLFVRDVPVASFHNDGNGGCCTWNARQPMLLDEATAFAKKQFPDLQFEQLDHLVGQLWDAAMSKPSVMP